MHPISPSDADTVFVGDFLQNCLTVELQREKCKVAHLISNYKAFRLNMYTTDKQFTGLVHTADTHHW